MKIDFGLSIEQSPVVQYVHSVSNAAQFKLDLGTVEVRLTVKEAEKLLEGLAREIILMRERVPAP